MSEIITVTGTVEEIIYSNPDNGYSVVGIDSVEEGQFTATGYMPFITEGESVALSGNWTTHPDYGEQFKAEYYETVMPSDEESIIKYLSSGIISGIREATAKKLIDHFGLDVLQIMLTQPSKLAEIKGISKEKAKKIGEQFAEIQSMQNIVMFLQQYGISATTAVKVHNSLGANSVELIKKNPKIICGYSDITSITNIITEKTGLVTFSGTNFKTIATDETDFSYKQALSRFVDGNLEFGPENKEYITIQEGKATGELIGGNLSLIRGMVAGKYSLDFTDKILFLEELGFETDPEATSNNVYYMKQNGVFDKIKGLWIGNYEHESGISLEKIILDVLDGEYKFPIIKSNNFGHIERKIVVPIGTKAEINTDEDVKIRLVENCVM